MKRSLRQSVREIADNSATSRRQVVNSLNDELCGSPYGPAIASRSIALEDFSFTEMWHIRPFALLWLICEASPLVSYFFKRCLGGHISSILITADAATVGNVLHPDPARKSLCAYFTLLDLPDWYRAMLPLSVMRMKTVKRLAGKTSAFHKYLLELFLPNDGSDGPINIVFPLGKESWTLHGDNFYLLEDAEGWKEAVDVKGFAGTKCCPWCANVVKGVHLPASEQYLKDFFEARLHNVDLCQAKDYEEIVMDLDAKVSTLQKTAFHRLEQTHGVKRNPFGLLWCEKIMKRFNIPEHLLADDMHNTLASGGVFQYVGNAVLFELEAYGRSLATVDSWARNVCQDDVHRLPQNFCQARRGKFRSDHLRCSASETIVFMYAISMYMQYAIAVQDLRLLRDFVNACAEVVHVMRMGDKACEYTRELLQLWEFICDNLSSFGIEPKPKMHYEYHVFEQMGRLKKLATGFRTERAHLTWRALADHSKRMSENEDQKLTHMRLASECLSGFKEITEHISPYVLTNAHLSTQWQVALQMRDPSARCIVYESKTLQSPLGCLRRNYHLRWKRQTCTFYCKAECFLQVSSGLRVVDLRFYVVAWILVRRGQVWELSSRREIVPMEEIDSRLIHAPTQSNCENIWYTKF